MDRPRAYRVGESDAAHPSEVLPRRGKTSVPARTAHRHTAKQFRGKSYLSEQLDRGRLSVKRIDRTLMRE